MMNPINRRAEHGTIEIKSRLIEGRLPRARQPTGILEIGIGHVFYASAIEWLALFI